MLPKSRRDWIYLIIGIVGLIITAFFFIAFEIPLNYGNLLDVSMVTLYIMFWTIWIISFLSYLAVETIPRVTKISEEKIMEKRIFVLSISMTAGLFLSLPVLVFTESFWAALIAALLIMELVHYGLERMNKGKRRQIQNN